MYIYIYIYVYVCGMPEGVAAHSRVLLSPQHDARTKKGVRGSAPARRVLRPKGT